MGPDGSASARRRGGRAPAGTGKEKTSVEITKTLRPFGLTQAVPVTAETTPSPVLALCPERQISVTEAGTPFVHEPSLKSQFITTSQTKEDNQLSTDNENDTD
ncbi:hypothetical protein CTZ27_01715 [Streptomyces griseocarneus]|nr:hypothetical protein CTZ27_01715 [Streptomyces griseocarneus]